VTNNEEDAIRTLPKDWFIPRRWMNFQSMEDERFPIKGLFDRVGWTHFLEKFSS